METTTTSTETKSAPPNGDATEHNAVMDRLQAIATKYDLKPTGSNPHERLLAALSEAHDIGVSASIPEPPAPHVSRETSPPLFRVPPKLAADLTRTMLEQARLHDKAWRTMTTAEQEQWRDKVRTTAEDAIGAVVRIVAAQNLKAKSFTMKKNEDDGAHIKITLVSPVEPDGDNTFLHDLVDHRSKPVVLVLADHEEYFQHHEASTTKARKAQGAQADIEDAIDETRPAIDTLSDDELATLMGGHPLRPSDKWFFTKEELAAEYMRREASTAAEHDAAVAGERPDRLAADDLAILRAISNEDLETAIQNSPTAEGEADAKLFYRGEYLAEQRRRAAIAASDADLTPRDGNGNPLTADGDGVIQEPAVGAAGEGGEGATASDSAPSPTPGKKPRKPRAAAADKAFERSDGDFAAELRSDTRGDDHIRERTRPVVEDVRAAAAAEDVGEL
jgi:hypothetical protein